MILLPVELSVSGRPLFLPGEVEVQLIDSTDLEFEDPPAGQVSPSVPLKHGIASITTHRLLWLEAAPQLGLKPRAFALPLATVASVHPPRKTVKSLFGYQTPRLRFRVWISRDGKLTAAQMGDGTMGIAVVLRSQVSDHEVFVAKIQDVMRMRAWEQAPTVHDLQRALPATSVQQGNEQRMFSTASAGVSGLLKKEEKQVAEANERLQTAFSDLNALMTKAKEMVALAERIRAKLADKPDSASEDGESARQEMQDYLLSVGITSPVTRENAGALYHQQLARQLADFIRNPLQREGGMLAVVDAYCLFNRARGTELISPEDLVQACTIWEQIDVPMRLRKFDSGVLVIQAKTHSDEAMFAKLEALTVSANGQLQGVGASDAARALGVPPALAKEELLAAESRGMLCRDDSPDGLVFYHNFFPEALASLG